MPADLLLTVRFLQPFFHGRLADDVPEWPPSPLRLFQALVASAIGRRAGGGLETATAALRWLERLPPPEVFAPSAVAAAPHRIYVPDNVADVAAKAWSAGRSAELSGFRTEKDVRPLRIAGEAVHYLYRSADGMGSHLLSLRAAAHGVTHLGWGIDLVAAHAAETSGIPEGERWVPGRHGRTMLRCAEDGTLEALERRHVQFLSRLEGGSFRPVPALTRFRVHPYARATDPESRPFAAFRLIEPTTGDRLSLQATRRARDVAAWVRHSTGEACEGWPFGPVASIVHGHGAAQSPGQPRFSFLPLPTLTPGHGAQGIARVLVAGAPGMSEEIEWVRSLLAGCELIWEGKVMAVLEPLGAGDWVVGRYVGASTSWTTVTPIVLPGFDDGSPRKAERLVRKALLQAGLEREVVEEIRQLDYRKVGFRQGVEHASRYLRPDKVEGPLFHVRVVFGRQVAGPLSVGSGRHRGLGVLAWDDGSRSRRQSAPPPRSAAQRRSARTLEI